MEWYDDLNPVDQEDSKCVECGTPIYSDKEFCSGTCFEGSLR
jgi:predicted nucleic acid-binding Zn ribbon protein